MVKNWLFLLSSVAFGVSFGISLLVNQDIKTALLTGLITLPATFLGVVAVNRNQRNQQKRTLTPLQARIHQLKKQETQLNQSCLAIRVEKQRIDTELNFLKTELSQLYTQIAEQRSCKQQLNLELNTLKDQKFHLEVELQDLQTQIQNCEQRRERLHQSLRSIRIEKQNVEDRFKLIPVEVEQLQVQVVNLQNQKEGLEADLLALTQFKFQLEEKLHDLHNQTQELEQRTLPQLLPYSDEENIVKVDIDSLQTQLKKLKAQILEQKIKDDLQNQLSNLVQENQIKLSENLSDKWNEFMMRIPTYEFQVLKAITEQVNTSEKIKKIAEENITMPELLIDFINQRALNTIGDLIIEPGSESNSPTIPEEYLTNVKKVIEIKDMN